jgi:hypothetical protein
MPASTPKLKYRVWARRNSPSDPLIECPLMIDVLQRPDWRGSPVLIRIDHAPPALGRTQAFPVPNVPDIPTVAMNR